jgi:hypothetical protein
VAKQLRLGDPAVFARVQDNSVQIDLRTVLPDDLDVLRDRILAVTI